MSGRRGGVFTAGNLSGATLAGGPLWDSLPSVRAARSTPSARPVRLELPIDRGKFQAAVAEAVVVLTVDNSGSRFGQYGTDPQLCRYAAGTCLVDLMARGGGGAVGHVPWGTSAPVELACPPVDVRRGRRVLDKAFRCPGNMGGNDLAAALRCVKTMLPPPQPGVRPIVLVETDGLEDIGPAHQAAVAALPPGSVHVVLIDRWEQVNGATEAAWQSLPLGSWTRLAVGDPDVFIWQIADVLVTALGLTLPPLAHPTKRRYLK